MLQRRIFKAGVIYISMRGYYYSWFLFKKLDNKLAFLSKERNLLEPSYEGESKFNDTSILDDPDKTPNKTIDQEEFHELN